MRGKNKIRVVDQGCADSTGLGASKSSAAGFFKTTEKIGSFWTELKSL
jgi:hypothetical protein